MYSDPPPLSPSAAPPSASAPRPHSLPVDFNAIPHALRQCHRWLLWRYVPSPDGTWQKAIFTARGNRTVPHDSSSGAPFDAVHDAYEYYLRRSKPFDGIAFALGDSFAAIELQNVFSSATACPELGRRGSASALKTEEPEQVSHETSGQVAAKPLGDAPSASPPLSPSASPLRAPHAWAAKLVTELATYTEISPDGLGLNLIVCGPFANHRAGPAVEPVAHPEGGTFAAWHQSRFVCVTGRRWPLHGQAGVEDGGPRFQQMTDQLRNGSDISCVLPGRPAPAVTGPAVINPPVSKPGDVPNSWINGKDPWEAHNKLPPELPKREPPSPALGERIRRSSDDRKNWMTYEEVIEQRARFRDLEQSLRQKRERNRSTDELIDLAQLEYRFGRTRSGQTFVVDRSGPNLAHLFRRSSEALRDTLARRARSKFGDTPAPSVIRAAAQWIYSQAAAAPPETLHLRLAPLPPHLREPLAAAPNADIVPLAAKDTVAVPAEIPVENQKHGRRNRRQKNLNRKERRRQAQILPFVPARSEDALASTHPKHETRNTKHEKPTPPPSDSIVLDLGREDGQSVLITAAGWQLVPRSPVPFRRTNITGEMPIPERGGRLDRLRSLINVSDQAWPLLRAWLIAAFFPSIAHPVLLLGGMQGAGKSTALRILSELIDPSPAPLRTEPKNFDHWALMAAAGWCIPLDNVSSIPVWLSDALCKAVTGDGFIRRRLYSDGDLTIIEFRRVVAMSSIDPGPLRGDLADRLLRVELDPIDDHRRLLETQLLESFERQKPQLLGALLDEVADVLRRLPEVRLDSLPRMADFAKILATVDGVALAIASPPPTEEREQETHNTSGPVSRSPLGGVPSSSPLHTKDEQPQAAERSVRGEAEGGSRFSRNPHSRSCEDGKDDKDDKDDKDGNSQTFFIDIAKDGNLTHASTALETYLAQNLRLAEEVVEGDALGPMIADLVKSHGVWQGTATELLSMVAQSSGESRVDRPKSASHLSRRLKRLAPALASIGIEVDFERKGGFHRDRQIRLHSRRPPPLDSN
jgi:hypothetical protein